MKKKKPLILWFLLITTLFLPITDLFGGQPTQSKEIVIEVTTDKVLSKVNPFVFGSNIQWENDGDGIIKVDQAKEQVTFSPTLIAKAKDLRISLLRFPGGTLADKYRWKNGIGRLSQRKPNLSFGDKLLPSNFGLDEFIRLCKLLGCQPLITVNFNMTPDEAKELVEYCNSPADTYFGKMRAQNGSDKPYNIKYWEIGNEIYSAVEPGYTTAENYARKYLVFYNKMKEADPKIKIGPCMEVSLQRAAWINKLYPHILTWNKTVADIVRPHLDFVSIHFYAPADYMGSSVKLHNVLMAAPNLFTMNLKDIMPLLNNNTEVLVTEYNIYFNAAEFRKVSSMQGGLFNGAMLLEMIKNNIDGACHWSLLNNGYFGSIRSDPYVIERPAYKVFKLIRDNIGDYQVYIEDKNVPVFGSRAFGSVPNMENLPVLETIATLNKDKNILFLVVINKSPDKSLQANIILKDFEGIKAVSACEIFSSALFSDNEDGERVKIRNCLVKLNNGSLIYSFKPASVTAIKCIKPGGK